MIRKLAMSFAVVLAAANFIACNSTYESVEVTASCAAVSSFKLTKDDSVMAHLDSVFFSIDLTKGVIFNADSLPCGTKVTALIPVISTLDGASIIEMTVRRAGKSDTTYNYGTHPTDSIDFTNPVSLRVVSPDGMTERTYSIIVNVHRTVTDSLSWSPMDRYLLPGDFDHPEAQHTSAGTNLLFTLTSAANKHCISYYHDIHDLGNHYLDRAPHTTMQLQLPFTPVVESFTALNDETLYLLSTDHTLYRSDNRGADWAACPQRWQTIIGTYDSSLIGITAGPSPCVEDLQRGLSVPCPADMPVTGLSLPVFYDFPMSELPQLMIVGGRKADGTLSADTWGYDGKSWARISKKSLPVALEGMVTVPYYTFKLSGSYIATELKTILAFGGRKSDGSLSKKVYMSTDYGYTWAEAPKSLQLPDEMPAMYDAQAFVFDTRHDASIIVPAISRPTESWECPYIYLFGGRSAEGTTFDSVWRGVINRMSFKPIE